MSRLTGTDAYSLMEAYQAVYTPQELTEEQVWEEVETWINSLVEEGYDLSDYTWEDMYESYLSEASDLDMGLGRNVLRNRNSPNVVKSTIGSTPIGFAAGARRGAAPRPQAPSIRDGRNSPPSGTDAAGLTGDRSKKGPKTVGPKLVGPKLVGPKIVGPKPSSPSGGGGSGGGGRSSTPSSTSPKSNPTKPTASAKPAIGKLGNTSFERRTPTSSELKAAQSARASGASPEKALQAAQKTNLPTQGSPDAKVDPKAVNDAIKAQQERDKNRAKPQAVNASYEYDAYDLVLEYLFSQGHVETLEEANYVMLVMDAETIGSIVEGVMPEPIDPIAHNKSQRLATQQGKIRALEGGATTPGEKSAAKSKLKGPQLPGV